MKKYRAVPKGYMTVGEVAKKMGVTVRTLQYYDKEGLLSPSSESEGGRRLYTDEDVIKLYQILSMKTLGFSLNDIKNHLPSLDTPADMCAGLEKQAAIIREKIKTLSLSLKEVEALKEEVLQIQQVDFKKYADIIVNLQMNNEYYCLIKHLDETTLDYFRRHFDKDSALEAMEHYQSLFDKAAQYQQDGVAPDSEEGKEFGKAFWNMLMEFTGGDLSMLPNLMETGYADDKNRTWTEKQEIAGAFIEPALEAYFTTLDCDPFEEAGP